MEKIIVKLDNVSKNFDKVKVVKNINLNIKDGEFLTILGPSGCGKTTILKMIAGFFNPTEGHIYIDGEDIAKLEPHQIPVNTIFQNHALFPHLNVRKNIEFGLKMKKVPKNKRTIEVNKMLKLVKLDKLDNRLPIQLSGGQKQRVAIARALVNHPKVLLLDEPLSSLDLKLKKEMMLELKKIKQNLGITFIYVTHDQEEALTMSDRIVIINKGKIEQIDTPVNIYNYPKTKFVADFIGESNLLKGIITKIDNNIATIKIGNIEVLALNQINKVNDNVYLLIRPEQLKITKTKPNNQFLKGTITDHLYQGDIIKIFVNVDDLSLKINRFNEQELLPLNSEVYISWDIEDALIIQD